MLHRVSDMRLRPTGRRSPILWAIPN